MAIEILKPGLATTVQDMGRPGYYHLGIPISGAMDRFSARAANLLVGNDPGSALLEATLLGPEIRFLHDTAFAVTGAEVPLLLNGEACPAWQTLQAHAGDVLSFQFMRMGARAYIAFAGGIDVPLIMNSRSTYLAGRMGGYKGRSLKDGDVLSLLPRERQIVARAEIPPLMRRPMERKARLRVIIGLYSFRVMPDSLVRFMTDTWQVGTEADRTGYRFKKGAPLEFVPRDPPFGAGSDPSNIVDSCYPYGSIQVPSGKEPIILHRDAVSAGGYFTLGTIISADMDLIAQLQPHQKVCFLPVSMDDALIARQKEQQRLNDLQHILSG